MLQDLYIKLQIGAYNQNDNLKICNVITRYYLVSKIAIECGWRGIDFQKECEMLSFKKGDSRINVYLSQMTIVTIVDHPKIGRNILNRKQVYAIDLVKKIFIDPRVHTGIGYHASKEARIWMEKKMKSMCTSGVIT